MALGGVTLVVPIASVLIAARVWRAQLISPMLFSIVGLTVLYLFVGYLMTRPIPSHAVPATVRDSEAEREVWVVRRLALLCLGETCVASVVVVALLRRLMFR
jgi:hypothetical protein